MAKPQKLYVIIRESKPHFELFSAIKDVSKEIGVSVDTLRRHFMGIGFYLKNGVGVYLCDVINFRGCGDGGNLDNFSGVRKVDRGGDL